MVLLEQSSTAHGIEYEVINLTNAFFSSAISNKWRTLEAIFFQLMGLVYTFMTFSEMS